MTRGELTCIEAVQSLNRNIFIPDFQREYAWNEEKIKKLFDSVLNEYPIGSIVLWRYKSDPTEIDFIYSFIENWVKFIPDDREHFNNQFDSVTSNRPLLLEDRATLEHFKNSNSLPFKLVVDGQQRLTSLNIGLNGGVIGGREDNYSIQKLYVNIRTLSEKATGSVESGEQDNLKFDLKFFDSNDVFVEREGELYYKLSHMSDCDSVKNQEMHRYKSECWKHCEDKFGPKYEKDRNDIRDGFDLLFNRLVYNNLNITTYETSSIDEVLQLFLRINIEDEQLEDSDILVAVLTSIWGQSKNDIRPINARKELRNFVEELNRDYEKIGTIQTEHIAKILLMLNDPGLGLELDKRAINNIDSEKIRQTKEYWDNDEIQDAIRKTLDMISDWNFHNLISSAADITYLFPIIYFFYEHPDASYISDPNTNERFSGADYSSEYLNTARIQYWICVALLHTEYTTQRHPSTTRKIFNIIENAESQEFPLSNLNEGLWTETGFNPTLRNSDIDHGLNQNISKQKPISLLTLLEIPFKYPDGSLELDHLQPKSLLQNEELLLERGYSERELQRVKGEKDKLGNRTLLKRMANNSKSDTELFEWIKEMEENKGEEFVDKFLEANNIPTNRETHKIENFMRFIQKRQDLLVDAIEQKYGDLYGRNANPNKMETYSTPDWY